MPDYTSRGIRYPHPDDHMRGTNASRSIIDDLRDLAITSEHADDQVLNGAKNHATAAIAPVRADLSLLEQYSMRIQHVYQLPNNVDEWIGHDKRGIYQAPIQRVVDEIVGAPEGSGPAIITVTPISTSGGVLIQWSEYSGRQRVWHRTLSATPETSRPWQLIGDPREQPPQGGGSGTKTIPLSLTAGSSGGSTAPTTGTVVIPTNWDAPILRWRLAVRDGNPRFGNVSSNPTTFTDITANGAVVIDQDEMSAGTDTHYTRWVEGSPDESIGYTYTAQDKPRALVGGGTLNGQAVTSLPFEMWVEAEVPAWVPVVAVVGDSNSVGVGTTTPIHDSWLSQYCRRVGALPVHYGHSGDYYGASTQAGHYKWTRWQHLDSPDVAIVALGSNDAGIGTPLAELKDQARAVWKIVSELVSPNLHTVTIKPRNSGDSSYNSIRRGYNTWVQELPAPLRAWHDMVSPVSSDDVTMDPGMYADNAHMSTAGHTALADSIDVPVAVSGLAAVSPNGALHTLTATDDGAVTTRGVELPPPVEIDTTVGTRVFVGDTMIHGDTGLRRVDTVSGQGFGYIRRIGNQVSIYFRDVIAPTGEIYILPTGFRPDVVPQYGLLGRTGGRDLATFTIGHGGSLTQGTTHDSTLYFSFTFNTNNAWPASLPGTPI